MISCCSKYCKNYNVLTGRHFVNKNLHMVGMRQKWKQKINLIFFILYTKNLLQSKRKSLLKAIEFKIQTGGLVVENLNVKTKDEASAFLFKKKS